MHKYRHYLPHWQVGGSTYFVTYSLREGIRELSLSERICVLKACLYWHDEKWLLHTCVVMPNHVHLVVTPLRKSSGEWWRLDELLKSVKSFSARELNRRRGVSGALWKRDYYDRIIRSETDFREKADYIVSNPVRDELVGLPDEYAALWYEGMWYMKIVPDARTPGLETDSPRRERGTPGLETDGLRE